jgi:hypothetical protein
LRGVRRLRLPLLGLGGLPWHPPSSPERDGSGSED